MCWVSETANCRCASMVGSPPANEHFELRIGAVIGFGSKRRQGCEMISDLLLGVHLIEIDVGIVWRCVRASASDAAERRWISAQHAGERRQHVGAQTGAFRDHLLRERLDAGEAERRKASRAISISAALPCEAASAKVRSMPATSGIANGAGGCSDRGLVLAQWRGRTASQAELSASMTASASGADRMPAVPPPDGKPCSRRPTAAS